MERKRTYILDAIKFVSSKIEACEIDAAAIKKFSKLTKWSALADYLGTNDIETAIFTAIYVKCYTLRTVDFNDIAGFFSCTPFDLLFHHESIESLVNKGLIVLGKHSNPFDDDDDDNDMAYTNCTFKIQKEVAQRILDSKPLDKEKEVPPYDVYQFVEEASKIIYNRRKNGMSPEDALVAIEELEGQHIDIKLVRDIKKMVANTDDREIFYIMANGILHSSDGVNLMPMLRDLYGNPHKKMQVSMVFQNNNHVLQQLELAELTDGGMFSDAGICLTDKGKEFFLQEEAALLTKTNKSFGQDVIMPDKMTNCELYFDDDTDKMYRTLKESLQEERFNKIQQGMKKRNMPTGVAALFYGKPGTGKTEMAIQIAKATGRALMHVDISETKSKWFGDSEKIIRKIFDRYRMLCRQFDCKPILLFNEADAVFSKRKDVENGNCAQTENAIQNIILEEMEHFDGILIATTNLADNLDRAFERRFLFKVRFERPSANAKAKIWKSKMPQLSDAEAMTLAKNYDFSGGEIENVVRKVMVEEVIGGDIQLGINEIKNICDGERINSRADNAAVGFKTQSNAA